MPKPKVLLTAALALVALVAPADAARRATRFDGIRDCERAAAILFKRHDPAFPVRVMARAAPPRSPERSDFTASCAETAMCCMVLASR